MNDIESIMDSMFIKIKSVFQTELNVVSAEKNDNLLAGWELNDKAFYLDALTDDFPPYKSSCLLFIASGPQIATKDRMRECIETYTLGMSVILADDFKGSFFRVKKRFSKALKYVITKHLIPYYINYNIKINSSKEDVITSPNGTMYQISAIYFDVVLVE
jgi:hypothetical protein